MKKVFSVLIFTLMILAVLPLSAMDAEAASIVDSGSCGANLTWTLDSDGLLTISGTGNMRNWECLSDAPWYDSRSCITNIVVENGVTSIGDYAFNYCSSLTSITIPNSVTSIGGSAFYNCSSLTSVTIPNSVTSIGDSAFYNCSSLTSVTIPNSVTSIGDYAFEDCSSLTNINVDKDNKDYCSIDGVLFNKSATILKIYPSEKSSKSYTIPSSVTTIGENAFSNCSFLTSVTIPNSVTSIGYYAFYGCSSLTSVTIPNSVTSIGYSAFNYCDSLTSITIPSGVIFIEGSAFYNCSSLTSVTIPNSVTSIGGSAFYNCSSLTSVTIPNSVTSIGDSAFYNCSSLTSVTIPNSVTSIGHYAFSYCSSLTSITIPSGVISIEDSAFYNCSSLTNINVDKDNKDYCSIDGVLFNKSATILKIYPSEKSSKSYTIPSSVTTIGENAFYNCSSLTSITIPNSVTSIGVSAFYNCSSLTSVTIPNSVTSIDEWAFYNCSSLTSVTIPNSVTSIDEWAFCDCNRLKDIYYKGTQEEWNKITICSNNENLTSATIHFAVPLKITKQPTDTSAAIGSTAKITVTAEGEEPTYTWYFKNAGASDFTKSAITSSTYSVTMLKTISGRQVYCVVTDKNGNTEKSNTVTLHFATTITKQPEATTAAIGSTAKITVAAEGEELTYAWYFKNPGSSAYTKSGIAGSTYTMTMKESLSGRLVYCIVSDKYGNQVRSNTVTVKALPLTITTQPKATYTKLNDTASITIAASGEGVKYAWYFKNPGNSTYTKSSITSSIYTMTMQQSLSGRLVYCMVTDKYGNQVRSNTISVYLAATITKQPTNATAAIGSKATASVTAAGDGLTYTWYFKNPGAADFTKSGITSSTYSVTMQKSLSGRQVYCVVTDKYGKTDKSNTVTLSTAAAVKITTQPKTTYTKVGASAKLTVAASGEGLKYTWYFKNPTASEFTKSGITSSTYSATMQKSLSGRQVYCVVTDKYGNSVKSNTVYLYLSASITKQPTDTTAAIGEKAKVSVTAAGDGLTYTWYFKNPGSSSFTKSGITSSTYSMTMQKSLSGRQVYCVITDKYGKTVTSDTVTITSQK